MCVCTCHVQFSPELRFKITNIKKPDFTKAFRAHNPAIMKFDSDLPNFSSLHRIYKDSNHK